MGKSQKLSFLGGPLEVTWGPGSPLETWRPGPGFLSIRKQVTKGKESAFALCIRGGLIPPAAAPGEGRAGGVGSRGVRAKTPVCWGRRGAGVRPDVQGAQGACA